MWAPKELLMKTNTSCQTDEYIAHRIGMIPFQKTGDGNSITLKVHGPGMIRSHQFMGSAFKSIHDDIEIMLLDKGQQLDFTVFFDKQNASKHARYSQCAALGMTKLENGDCHKISFDSIGEETPKELMIHALNHFDQRIDKALLAMANQPIHPPKSMC
jgi:hypothetical protein